MWKTTTQKKTIPQVAHLALVEIWTMDLLNPKLRGLAVFVVAFLLVSVLSYVPLISWLAALLGKIVLTVGVGAGLIALLQRYLDRDQTAVDPRGKAVFITGCDTGFGHELAQRLHKLGFHVFAGCISASSPGAEALRAVESADGRLDVLAVDVTNNQQVLDCAAAVKDKIQAKRLELHAVVNNAGIFVLSEFEWIPVNDYENMMNVNALGSVRVTKAFLPMLRDSGGRIVMVASLTGRYAIPGMVGYAMSKHAQVALADGLRRELKKFGIRVSIIEPGMYKTGLANIHVGLSVAEKHWKALPEELRKTYGESYYGAMRHHLEQTSEAASPLVSEPVDCIEEAIISQNPQLRYKPGNLAAKIRGFVVPLLPFSVQDQLIERFAVKAQPEHRYGSR